MGTYVNQDISLHVNGLQVACHAKSATLSTEVAVLDRTPLCTQGWVELLGGLKSGQFNFGLMADHAEGGLDEVMFAALGLPTAINSITIGSTVGSVGWLWRGLPTSYTPFTGSAGELAAAALSGSGSGPVIRGKALAVSSAVTSSSGAGTAIELGEVPAGKSLYAALHIISVTGTSPTLDVKVQSDDSSGFSSATDRITFAQANAVGAQWGSVAGPVTDEHWRITATIGGSSSPGFAFAVVAGFI